MLERHSQGVEAVSLVGLQPDRLREPVHRLGEPPLLHEQTPDAIVQIAIGAVDDAGSLGVVGDRLVRSALPLQSKPQIDVRSIVVGGDRRRASPRVRLSFQYPTCARAAIPHARIASPAAAGTTTRRNGNPASRSNVPHATTRNSPMSGR